MNKPNSLPSHFGKLSAEQQIEDHNEDILGMIKERYICCHTEGCRTHFCVSHSKPTAIKQELESCAESAKKEERERIAQAMHPVFDDFLAAGRILIKKGYTGTGTEIIESIGYMKSVLLSFTKGEDKQQRENIWKTNGQRR